MHGELLVYYVLICVFIGFEWMLQQTTDGGCDSEVGDEMMIFGLQRQTLPIPGNVVYDKRGGKVLYEYTQSC